MNEEKSPLEKVRLHYLPSLPEILQDPLLLSCESHSLAYSEDLAHLFPKTCHQPLLTFQRNKEKSSSSPLKVGVVFSGGQASGGHNVVAGLFDTLKKIHPHSQLLGFRDGPGGIVKNQWMEISHEQLAHYRNQGGFDLLGSGRTKIEKKEDLESAGKTMLIHRLDGLVIIGGDDSNTNAAILAEFFLQKNISTRVVGVPKTIDGDLQNEHVDISFGFDTATKTYAELIGNIAKDALSARKYYHFIKLMGRSASHIALECALQTHPNVVLIGEELLEKKKTLQQIVEEIVDLIVQRAAKKKNYGVVLIPEGIVEFFPEMQHLIAELNQLFLQQKNLSPQEVVKLLKKDALRTYLSLPEKIQEELLLERDPHGNVLLSQIETEKLFIDMIQKELVRKESKVAFHALSHFFGYEGRSALPSNFDAQYGNALGSLAAILIFQKVSGYMCALSGLYLPINQWQPKGVPLYSLLHLESRGGQQKPVIKKALVDLKKKPFLLLKKHRDHWAMEDGFQNPGPIQFFGDPSFTDSLTISLKLKNQAVSI